MNKEEKMILAGFIDSRSAPTLVPAWCVPWKATIPEMHAPESGLALSIILFGYVGEP